MTRERENYLVVLMTMQDELKQAQPNLSVLHNCRLFLTEAPLPNDAWPQLPAGTQWGNC